MCSRTRENNKNKVKTDLWDTLYFLLTYCRLETFSPDDHGYVAERHPHGLGLARVQYLMAALVLLDIVNCGTLHVNMFKFCLLLVVRKASQVTKN